MLKVVILLGSFKSRIIEKRVWVGKMFKFLRFGIR